MKAYARVLSAINVYSCRRSPDLGLGNLTRIGTRAKWRHLPSMSEISARRGSYSDKRGFQ